MPYETAEEVKNHYYNLNFMPQKKEKDDVKILMQMSKEFNPIISFDVFSMEHSGSGITSSCHDYSYHNRNASASDNGNFALYAFQDRCVREEIVEQNEEDLI